MLISSKNADLGRTVRKPGTSFLQATQTENPGPKTEFGLVNQTHLSKRRGSQGSGNSQNSPQ